MNGLDDSLLGVFFACGPVCVQGERTRPRTGLGLPRGVALTRRQSQGQILIAQLQPDVPPQVLHFMQVPLRTNV